MTQTASYQSEHIGARLATARRKAGMSVSDVAEMTLIRDDFLCAIENLDTKALPSIGYVLGFVRTYAKALGLDDDEAVAEYKRNVAVPENLGMRSIPHFVPTRSIKLPRGIIPALTVLGFGAMIGVWYGVNTETQAAPNLTVIAPIEGEAEPVMPISADMVTVRTTAPSWVQIKDAEGTTLVSRIFVSGETWQGPVGGGYSLSVRDSGAIEIYLGENKRPPLGGQGEAKYDVILSQH